MNIEVKNLFELYLRWKNNNLDNLIDSQFLKSYLSTNSNILTKCTTASETNYNKFVVWCSYIINDYDFLLKYGDRRLSRTVDKLLYGYGKDSNNEITIIDSTISRCYKIIFTKNIDNWLKKFVAYNLTEYKPLDNYNMEEIRTPDLTESVTSNGTVSGSKNTNTDLSTTTNSDSQTGIFGFNSGSVSNPTADGVGSTTVNTTGDSADNYEEHEQTTDITETKEHTGTETLTRSGNIGVTTSQQMLQSELDLRNQILVDEIYKALAEIMTNPVY